MFDTLNLISPFALALTKDSVDMLWQTPLLGMVMVFAVLALLWAVLAIFKIVFAKPQKEKKAPAPVVDSVPVIETVEKTAIDDADDGELVAIITAAVAAYMATEEPNAAEGGFRVVSFRRANGGKAWNAK